MRGGGKKSRSNALLITSRIFAATLTVGETDAKGSIEIFFDCTLPTQSLVFSVYNGTQAVPVLGANPVYFKADVPDGGK